MLLDEILVNPELCCCDGLSLWNTWKVKAKLCSMALEEKILILINYKTTTDKPEEQVVALMCFKKDYPPYRPSGYNIAIINGLLFSPRGTHTHKHTRWKKNPFDLQKESLHRHWKGTKANHLVQSDGKATVVSQNIQSVLWCVLLCPQLGSTRVEIGKILLPWVKWLI